VDRQQHNAIESDVVRSALNRPGGGEGGGGRKKAGGGW